jgi:hypothetical protein
MERPSTGSPRGVTMSRAGSDREYAGRVEGAENVSLVLLSAGEIPRELRRAASIWASPGPI